jgi:hypothetical protein
MYVPGQAVELINDHRTTKLSRCRGELRPAVERVGPLTALAFFEGFHDLEAFHFCESFDYGITLCVSLGDQSADAQRGAAHCGQLRQAAGAAAALNPTDSVVF